MTALPDFENCELPVSEARERLADVIAAVENGRVVHLTRYGRRVAAVVAEEMAESADHQIRALSNEFATKQSSEVDEVFEIAELLGKALVADQPDKVLLEATLRPQQQPITTVRVITCNNEPRDVLQAVVPASAFSSASRASASAFAQL